PVSSLLLMLTFPSHFNKISHPLSLSLSLRRVESGSLTSQTTSTPTNLALIWNESEEVQSIYYPDLCVCVCVCVSVCLNLAFNRFRVYVSDSDLCVSVCVCVFVTASSINSDFMIGTLSGAAIFLSFCCYN